MAQLCGRFILLDLSGSFAYRDFSANLFDSLARIDVDQVTSGDNRYNHPLHGDLPCIR
jgi:hypothetical protein